MNKWFMKRDFSIPTHLLTSKLQDLSTAKPAPDALFWKMWKSCEAIAQSVLNTEYFKGIKDASLDPRAYGILMVQDAYYCFKAQDSYTSAATHAFDDTCKEFIEGKCASYVEYNKYYHETWRIREYSGVMPYNEIKEYAAYEEYVAGNLDSPYLFSVMLPCEYLWNWIANQLAPQMSENDLYHFWIDENGGEPNGAYQMANMLEKYRPEIDEARAMEIFQTAMQHELTVFTEATKKLGGNELWQKKSSI